MHSKEDHTSRPGAARLQWVIRQLPGLLLVAMLCTGLAIPSAARWDGGPGTGPGGVGSTDGSSTLELWLRADAGTFEHYQCHTPAAGGGTVRCWADQSGNGQNPINGTEDYSPTRQENVVNGQAVLRFDGSNDWLQRAYNSDLNPAQFTLFAVAKMDGGSGSYRTLVCSQYNDTAEGRLYGYMLRATSSNQWTFRTGTGAVSPHWTELTGPAVTLGSWELQTAWYGGSHQFFFDGALKRSNAATYAPNTYRAWHIGDDEWAPGSNPFSGDIAEVILYSTALGLARQTLVENYLSARYDIALDTAGGAKEVYAGDTSGNGNYDLDVAGIGRESTDSNAEAHSAGMVLLGSAYLADNGDYVVVGHNTAENDLTGADVTSPVVQRWLRHWYLDRTDGGSSSNGDLTIAFDFSEGADSTPGAGANYRLLYRSGTSGDFAPVTVASTSVVDDQVRFQVAEANLADGYYTLGTTDAGGSPLLVQLVSFTAAPQPGGARVAWETASEIDNAGFNLYRQAGEGAWIRLNAALIPAQGGPTQGASYTFDDVGVPPPEVPSGTSYSYWLEDVDVHGQTTRHGPVVVDLGELPTSVGLIGFGASGASALVALLGVIAGALALGAGGLAWSRRCRRA